MSLVVQLSTDYHRLDVDGRRTGAAATRAAWRRRRISARAHSGDRSPLMELHMAWAIRQFSSVSCPP
jgi:hypothetical protein